MITIDLIRHRYLEYRRNPQFYGNTLAKVMMYFAGLMFAGYLLLFGFITPSMFGDLFPAYEPYHIIGKWFAVVLAVDMAVRFMYQKSPSSGIKPYYLLPINRRRLVNLLMLGNVTSLYNLMWLCFAVPFAAISVTRFYGFGGFMSFVCAFILLILFNNLLFIIFRVLINRSVWFVVLPVVFYLGMIVAVAVSDGVVAPLFVTLGDEMASHGWMVSAALLPLLALMWLAAYRLVSSVLRQELAATSAVEGRARVTDYSFFDRFGDVGAYMKLEMKMVMRNKNCRTQFILGLVVIAMFVGLLFAGAYETTFMHSFALVYVFSVFGIMILSMTMSYEGNYIDCLLVREVSILTLLKAKYYLQCLFAVLPLLAVIPLMVDGSVAPGTCLALYLFTCGAIFPLVLQLAVYNKKSAPLNETVNVKSSNITGINTLITMVALFVPSLLLTLLDALLDQLMTNLVLAVMGLAGMMTSGRWLGNIYGRFNKRKYENLEGFRATR